MVEGFRQACAVILETLALALVGFYSLRTANLVEQYRADAG